MEDKTLTANFIKVETHTVTYEAGEGGYVVGDRSQEIVHGKAASEVVAISQEGYTFTSWSDGVLT